MPSAAGHGIAVEACRRRIAAGDLFQANLCVRLEAQIVGAPVDLFAVAAAKLKPDRAAFFATPSGAVASLSPELFLRRRGNAVASAPIKGTRPRPRDDRAAAGQRQELATSPKDRAENVMIVDLVRNDLGRVCRPGSVRVRELCQVRPHAGVWHLVSEVVGTVPDETAHSELVRPAFPPGSVTGAPKIAAMNVIAELESTPRQLYTGAIGFASPLAGLELSVAIRTFEFAAQKVWLGVGGGIVADSDGAAEAAECVTKAAPLLAAIGARPPGQARESNAPPIRRLAPRPVPRPDPARGVFETLLVSDGRALRPQLHLARLASSVAELYGAELPVGIASAIQAAAARRKRARLRLDVRPVGRGVATRIQVSGLSARTLPVPLHAVTLPGGLGAHKWADRRLLDALADDLEGREPLLCDIDGRVLEARRASVFLVPGAQRILTPPADGRILPGVTRARVIELASELGYDVRTEPIDLAQLADAREIFVTGSLGGVEPAELDGQPARDRQISEELAHALRPPSVPLSDKLVQALASSDTGTG
jgi:para-aminobenzoate synthetase/4-amino-4-deoxychorismate lyase